MFRHRQRRPSPFSDFINWTDYRWDASPSLGATPSRPSTQPGGERRYRFSQLLLAGLAVVIGLKLVSSVRGSRSWLGKALLAMLFVAIASAVSNRRRRGRW
ncbi:MAG TPA: hypothetical protein VI485_02795 [Vicinamibacterales bacterium]|nr:hypothetical protein [Vicinamibacterales bacterium]